MDQVSSIFFFAPHTWLNLGDFWIFTFFSNYPMETLVCRYRNHLILRDKTLIISLIINITVVSIIKKKSINGTGRHLLCWKKLTFNAKFWEKRQIVKFFYHQLTLTPSVILTIQKPINRFRYWLQFLFYYISHETPIAALRAVSLEAVNWSNLRYAGRIYVIYR